MGNNKIKVVGYAQKTVYNGDIEYRNFSDDLVGLQQTGDSSFTFGNFSITTTLDSKPNKIFTTNKFSNFITLNDLDLTNGQNKVLLDNNTEVKLKLDVTDMSNYAYFGSLLEYVRVSLEDIITKWPASIVPNVNYQLHDDRLTVEDYNYSNILDEATFKVDVTYISNPYNVNFLTNGTLLDTYNEGNDMRNLTVNFLNYAVLTNDVEYDLLGFTGSTAQVDDYIYLRVKGNPFNVTGTSKSIKYHIKPNKLREDEFFNLLPDFQNNLLNRLTSVKYTSTYKFSKINDNGIIIKDSKIITWPVTDGYNIDFNTAAYSLYVSDLIDIATSYDETKSNLMVRFLTSESISDFDTVPRCDGVEEETAGQKMNKTLKIYGREYDEIKRRINGIQYANTVSYDQMNNTPDIMLKQVAKTMGWGLISSVLENDLLQNYVTTPNSSYSGMSRGYTAIEAEVEMWRRLILNTPWIWKSKGARKSIEFMFKFIGAPDGLIEFNEFIYLAKEAIDVKLFRQLLIENDLDSDITLYNIDDDGYPRVPSNNPNMYFQKGGLWYRQTAGSASTVDITDGNNPHVGPYDGGAQFINQFNELIPNFSPVTITSTTTTTESTNLFTNYKSGTINSYNGDYFVDVVSNDDIDLSDCVLLTTNKVIDPYPSDSEITNCGCGVPEDDYALLINIDSSEATNQRLLCDERIDSYQINTDKGYYEFNYKKRLPIGATYTSDFISTECCDTYGGFSVYKEEWTPKESLTDTSTFISSGYLCCSTAKCGCDATCNWTLATINYSELFTIAPYTSKFLTFKKPDGTETAVVPTGCSCISYLTTKVNVTDPITGDVGYGCMLTENGVDDLIHKYNSGYYYYDILNNNQVMTWEPIYDSNGNITNESTKPDNSYRSYIELVYNSRSLGLIPCTQSMQFGWDYFYNRH